jgi:large conductance mechanosensitive channel
MQATADLAVDPGVWSSTLAEQLEPRTHLLKETLMLKGFRQFMLRGNVVDLAVAVIIGGAFGAVINGLVKDLITPLIAAVGGRPDFSAIAIDVNGSKILIGDFLNVLISFLVIGTAVYFFIVVPVNSLTARMRRGEPTPDPTTKKCPECLSEVPIAARRCAFCTSPLSN